MNFRVPTLLLLTTVSCASDPPSAPLPEIGAGVRLIDSPATAGSGEPDLISGADGRLYLSWIEPDPVAGHRLQFSVWEGDGWSPARIVAAGAGWFVNWADFPTLSARTDGTLAAHWLAKSAEPTFAYDVWVSVSTDGGQSWSAPTRPHDDGTPTEHGFVSIVPDPVGGFDLLWLDGRQMDATPPGTMTLRHGRLDRDGVPMDSSVIDGRVCECCQTDALRSGDGTLIVAYRDRSDSEIRDISLSRLEDGRWTSPRIVHQDNWKTAGCPVNGPALASSTTALVVAWFTAPDQDRGIVRLAFSRDAGGSFDPPVRVDLGNPLGRVDVELLPDDSALVSWMEQVGKRATIQIRRVVSDGAMDPPRLVAQTTVSRSSGFPRLASHDDAIFLAWTATGEPSGVRTAILP